MNPDVDMKQIRFMLTQMVQRGLEKTKTQLDKNIYINKKNKTKI